MSSRPLRSPHATHTTSRRALLTAGGLGLLGLAGCITAPDFPLGRPTPTPRPPVEGPADSHVELSASTALADPTAAGSASWGYGSPLGPELRVTEGDVLRVDLTNDLPEPTTVHWHGIPLSNPMDGVPGVTQPAIEPGESFTYQFRAEPAGTYFYHSHVGLQLDRGLLGPLVVEERDPHVAFDRDVVVVFDDALRGAPSLPTDVTGFGPGGTGTPWTGGRGPGGMGPGVGPGGMGPGMMTDARPPYVGHLVDGRFPNDPAEFSVREGERFRFRFVNASAATTYRVRLAGHTLRVSHADGRPVAPVDVDSFVFGAGERYDAVVTMANPGTWELRATPLDAAEPPARAVVRYEGEGTSQSPQPPSGGGRELRYADLVAESPLDGIDGRPDRTFDLGLSRGAGGYVWTMGGQAYPEADPLRVRTGEHVRVRLTNQSPVLHPMHLHGHFFRVGDAVKDTVLVPPFMGQTTLDFVADNPGAWFFHCHNVYHMESGMARVVRYV